MKKKAKFVIEIEYEDDSEGVVDDRGIKVIEYATEGDYHGLTLALTTGLGFATVDGATTQEKFVDKLRLLRSASSALVSIFGTLNRMGAMGKGLVTDKLEQALFGAVKKMTDLTTLGISMTMDISPDDLIEANKEYLQTHNKNTSHGRPSETQRRDNENDLDDIIG